MRMLLAAVACCLLMAGGAAAEVPEPEALDTGAHTYGGYGAVGWKVMPVAGETGNFFGVRGGWVIDRVWTVGLGIYGLAGNLKPGLRDDAGRSYTLHTGHAGVEAEYIPLSSRPVRFVFGMLLGAGTAEYRSPDDRADNVNFLMAEPSAGVEVSLSSSWRASLSAGYAFVSRFDLIDLDSADFGGFSLRLLLKRGAF